jgi:hypothetical protein
MPPNTDIPIVPNQTQPDQIKDVKVKEGRIRKRNSKQVFKIGF